MCITRNELEKKIEELRSLKALKEETENELKALEHEVISYMTEFIVMKIWCAREKEMISQD